MKMSLCANWWDIDREASSVSGEQKRHRATRKSKPDFRAPESVMAASVQEFPTVYGVGNALPTCLADSKQEGWMLRDGKEMQA